MNIHKLDNENMEQYIWRIGQAKDAGAIDMSWNELADVMNVETGNENMPFSSSVYRKSYSQAKRFYEAGVFDIANSSKNSTSSDRYGSDMSINKDGSYTSSKLVEMSGTQSKDPKCVLKAHGFDPSSWELVSAKNSVWQKPDKGEGCSTLYASKITAKPIACGEVPLEKISEFFDRLDRTYSLRDFKKDTCFDNGRCLLLIDIADLHMNLQASFATTGNEYDCDIAEELFYRVIENVLTRSEGRYLDKIVFCIGGDMLNGDNLAGSTTKGTPQDSDIHYYDAYERLCAMTIKAIDKLRERAGCVDIIYVPGNHDEVTGFKLAKYVEAWFRNDDDVNVDSRPFARKYYLYGKTLMCFAHDGKVQKLPAIIANEARDMWSQADTVEVFLQHLHTEQVLVEENNIRIQRLPTISGRSKWSADNGYGSKRQCKSFIFDYDDGLTDILYTPIKAD